MKLTSLIAVFFKKAVENSWVKSAYLLVLLNIPCYPRMHRETFWKQFSSAHKKWSSSDSARKPFKTGSIKSHRPGHSQPQWLTSEESFLQHLTRPGRVPGPTRRLHAADHSILHVGAGEEELFGNTYRFQGYWVDLPIPSCIGKLALNW